MENNMQSYHRQTDEISVDLLALLYHLLKKWRVYILLVFIGAILGLGMTLLANEEPAVEGDAINMANVDMNRVQIYQTAKNQYDYQEEYMRNSLLLKMDENHCATGTLRYFINVPSNEMELISELYSDMMSQPELWNKIRETTNLDCEERYLRELVRYSFDNLKVVDSENTEGVSSDREDRYLHELLRHSYGYLKNVNDENSASTGIYSTTLTFDILGTSIDECQQMLEILRISVEKLRDEISHNHEQFTMAKVSEWTYQGYNEFILSNKRNQETLLSDYAQKVLNAATKLTADEKKYCSEISSEEKEVNNNEVTSPKVERSIIYYAKKPILISIVLVFLAAVYYCIQFLLDSRIRCAEDVITQLGLHLIAFVQLTPKSKLKGIDALLAKLFEGNKRPANSKEFVLQALRATGAKSSKTLVLCGDDTDDCSMKLMQWVSDQDLEILHAGFLHCSEQAQQMVVDSRGIVLIAKLGKTTKQQIQRDLDICSVLKLPVVGIVAID